MNHPSIREIENRITQLKNKIQDLEVTRQKLLGYIGENMANNQTDRNIKEIEKEMLQLTKKLQNEEKKLADAMSIIQGRKQEEEIEKLRKEKEEWEQKTKDIKKKKDDLKKKLDLLKSLEGKKDMC